MRIARWQHGAEIGEGFVIGDRVVPFPDGLTVAQVLAQGLDAAHALVERSLSERSETKRHPLADVRLLAPLVPAAIRDFVTFEEHVEGVSAGVEGKSEVVPEWYQAPTFYFTNPHTVLGPGEAVSPPVTERLDFELELAAVIGGVEGSAGANLTAEAAASHIFGYTIMNDWSARDLQAREMKVRLGPAKGKDFGTSLGPWIVTADELQPFLDDDGFLALRAEVFVNGELIGYDLVSNMGWPFARAGRLRVTELAGRARRRARLRHRRQRRLPRRALGEGGRAHAGAARRGRRGPHGGRGHRRAHRAGRGGGAGTGVARCASAAAASRACLSIAVAATLMLLCNQRMLESILTSGSLRIRSRP